MSTGYVATYSVFIAVLTTSLWFKYYYGENGWLCGDELWPNPRCKQGPGPGGSRSA